MRTFSLEKHESSRCFRAIESARAHTHRNHRCSDLFKYIKRRAFLVHPILAGDEASTLTMIVSSRTRLLTRQKRLRAEPRAAGATATRPCTEHTSSSRPNTRTKQSVNWKELGDGRIEPFLS
ncbi:hypothetical protein EVAR_97520_1 [Eumeta japonica]|uniref:Uncharacterized protein n=1 Tax=Eumeta variegata TaxID=151549 RepID=A0A4C1WMH1_EUMVA|nr:hypothetical protein EVAR_97520_1 [Eumeta japonica]